MGKEIYNLVLKGIAFEIERIRTEFDNYDSVKESLEELERQIDIVNFELYRNLLNNEE